MQYSLSHSVLIVELDISLNVGSPCGWTKFSLAYKKSYKLSESCWEFEGVVIEEGEAPVTYTGRLIFRSCDFGEINRHGIQDLDRDRGSG